MPIIKTHHNRNRYLLSNSYWVRDFTKTIKPQDINNFTNPNDHNMLATNESKNLSLNLPDIGSEKLNHPKILIVSDGYNFQKYKSILTILPKDIIIIGVNRSLANWMESDQLLKAKMSYYVINNPYENASGYLPAHNYTPKCIASIRTNHQFLKKYKGFKYTYTPVFDQHFGQVNSIYYQIDDYRNPVCAAIGLAYRFNVRKLGLFCCDDAFGEERPSSIKLDIHESYIYPQHLISHALIDGNLYWLRQQEDIKVETANLSCSPDYENTYSITEPDKLISFFAS